jgi:hypothetical protein
VSFTTPKTWSFGEVLTATDMNTYVRDNTQFLFDRGIEFEVAASNTVNLDFSSDRVVTRAASGAVTFTASNYTAGNSVSVRIVAGGASRNLTFPAGWKFVSAKPTSLASGKVGVLAVTSFGTAEADAVAAWAFEV